MPLRNTLHKIAESLHHDKHHDSSKHSDATNAEWKATETYSAPMSSATVDAYDKNYEPTLKRDYEYSSSTAPDLLGGMQNMNVSDTVAVSTADTKSTVYVDTTLQATEVTNTSYETLAPVTDTTVVHETVIREKVEEVQPVIHRQVVEPEIHRVIAPIMEHEKKQVFISEKNLGEIVKDTVVEQPNAELVSRMDTPMDASTIDIKSNSTVVELKPIVIEHHVRQVIEEIQPVIHRTIEEPELVKERVDIYETVVRAPVVYEEKREVIYRDASTSTSTNWDPMFPSSQEKKTTHFEGKSWDDKSGSFQQDTLASLPSTKSSF